MEKSNGLILLLHGIVKEMESNVGKPLKDMRIHLLNQVEWFISLFGLSLKIKKLRIYLYFIAAKYLWNNAIVEYIDSWIRS